MHHDTGGSLITLVADSRQNVWNLLSSGCRAVILVAPIVNSENEPCRE